MKKYLNIISKRFQVAWRDIKRVTNIDPQWLAVWLIIYFGFIVLDLTVPEFAGSAMLKYLGIFLCLVYAYRKYRLDTLLNISLLATLIGDTLLVWTPYEVAGVLIFCISQLLHLIRMTQNRARLIFTYAGAILLIFIFAVLQANIVPIYAITAIYAFLILSNLGIAHRNYRENFTSFRHRCAFYAFFCFVCCDVCVALRHLMLDGVIPTPLLPLIAFLIWVFYYPSQVLMANSSLQNCKKPAHKVHS